jgi:hypothetical protein
LTAQAVAAGRVVKHDQTAVPGVRVVLHRVGQSTQGPLDSTASGPDGWFRFRFKPDTAAIYLLSARYAGVEYFSPPVRLDSEQPDTAIPVVVYDTSSSVPIALAARHIVIPRPGEDGRREVLDLVVLDNPGTLARVARDSLSASWSAPLPPGSEGLEVGQGDVSPDAIERRGDSIFLSAPIGPGERQVSLQYHLPQGKSRVEIPFGREGGTVNVLVEEPGAAVSAPGLALADTQLIGGRTFRRYAGEIAAGRVISVRVPGFARTPILVLRGLVAAAALTLALAGWRLMRRRPEAAQESLLDRLAALDARYLGRQHEVEGGEWAGYQAERARLKRELETALAPRGSPR